MAQREAAAAAGAAGGACFVGLWRWLGLLLPEFLLSHLPQRVDIVVVRRIREVAGEVRKIRSIIEHLRAHTLIEHKGLTDTRRRGSCRWMVAEEGRVYTALYQQVEQFRKKRGSMAIRDMDAAKKSYEEVFDEIIDQP